MKHRSSPYLKMRVLGAIDVAEGNSRQQRIRRVRLVGVHVEEIETGERTGIHPLPVD